MSSTQAEIDCNIAIRRAARKGRIIVVEQMHRDGTTGRFVAGGDMNRLIREQAGRAPSTKA